MSSFAHTIEAFACSAGPLPESIGNLTNLTELYLLSGMQLGACLR
jgi:hypothetical protein